MIRYFIECLVPETRCNLKCSYCYVNSFSDEFKRKNNEFLYPLDTMLSGLTPERLGGICFFSICGAGETLLKKEVVQLVRGLVLLGHYVNITTNGTATKRYREICDGLEKKILSKIHFSFSFHYDELKRTNTIETYFSNVLYVSKQGCSTLCQINLTKSYISQTTEIQKLFNEKLGCLPQAVLTRDPGDVEKIYESLERSDYKKNGDSYESPLFEFTFSNHNKKVKDICFAGYYSFTLNLANGIATGCYGRGWKKNLFSDTKTIINPSPVVRCKSPFCVNGSHFCALGMVPSYACPTYYALRNRYSRTLFKNLITEEMKQVMNAKFKDPTHNFSPIQKCLLKLAKRNLFPIKFLKLINWNYKN